MASEFLADHVEHKCSEKVIVAATESEIRKATLLLLPSYVGDFERMRNFGSASYLLKVSHTA